MGCASSKLDDLPAVALCRERCTFLDEAINQRYALAAAHVAYINSLRAIGHSLHLFVQQDRDFAASPLPSPSPSPPHKTKNHHLAAKHDSPSPPHSDSGSHLHFHSGSDDDDDLGSLHHSPQSSPMHLNNLPDMSGYYDDSRSQPDHQHHTSSNFHMNFMKNRPAPSIVYEQRPMNPNTVYVGESSSSSSFYPPYPPQSSYPYSNSNNNNYNNYSFPPAPFYGSSPPPPPAAASSSKPPPPPPSPPRASTWDFLNFFDSDDKMYYPQTHYTPTATPSRDSREVREDEGIPELEEEDYHHHQQQQQEEVVKQVHGDHKRVDPNHHESHAHAPSSPDEGPEVEYEVHVVDKKVVDDDDSKPKPKPKPNDHAAFRPGSRNPLEVAKEIEILFQKASESGAHIAKILEVGKLPYHPKHGAYQGLPYLPFFFFLLFQLRFISLLC